ncbi:MAG TPA: PAS domain-containing protein [Chryseolinea sp.]|nr:PAS domain-containing protein [Chryseolinea sp.]
MSEQPVRAIAEMLQELDISRQILRIIFDNIKSAMLLCAPDTRIIFVNKHARLGSMTTHGRAMQVGESIMSYRVEGDEEIHQQFRANFERALQTKTPIVDEREMHFAPVTFWIRTEYTPIFDGDKIVGVLLHFHNITDRKKMETWTEYQANILNHIAWSQSHETRQPLATLLGLINILDKTSLTDENKEIIALVEKSACKLETVISQNVIRANMGSTNEDRSRK